MARVKAAVEGANSAYEGVQTAAKQAIEAAETSFDDIIDVQEKASKA